MLLLGASVPQAFSQLTLGTVSGSIRDAQDAAVVGATVTLTNESLGNKLLPSKPDNSGDFTIPNLSPGTYTLEVSAPGFKTLRRPAISVSPGDRVALGVLKLEVGAVTESMTVSAEAAVVKTDSGEMSYTIAKDEVQSIPMSNRNFSSMLTLVPGVSGSSRVGDVASSGGGNANYMMDGISTMDSGNNGQLIAVNTEAISEIKILTSGYQAEYGRSSGLQITAVTKSGTDQFHGSGFLIMRQSGWNARNKTDILNLTPKAYNRQKDIGFTVGGPIGKLHHQNKLFFFFSDEFDPRTFAVTGSGIADYRFPTALERQGDFSQTTDNLGNPYPYIRDPLSGKPCSSSNTSGCFSNNGVLGQIPQSRLYPLGLQILNRYPQPNLTTPGLNYNYQISLPSQSIMSQAPIVKFDFLPTSKLRGSFKYNRWGEPANLTSGTLPGFNDSQMYTATFYTWATTVSYTLTPSTFLEVTVGSAENQFAGCILAQGSAGPSLCTSAIPMDKAASLTGSGLSGLPLIYPNAGQITPSYYAFNVMQTLKPPMWDGTKMNLIPNFSWGGRIANGPPNPPFPGYLNINHTYDSSVSLTKIKGAHNLKAGIYWNHSFKAQQQGNGSWNGSISFANDNNNPNDSTFGYANAALGIYDTYSQLSKYIEGDFVYTNLEGFVQDNWKISPKLTLDYGLRLVHQTPQYDELGSMVNFVPGQWSTSNAPTYYIAGCVTTSPCTGTNRQAEDPRTHALLGPTSGVQIGTLVPGTGSITNGLFKAGVGPVPTTGYNQPAIAFAPRFGAAYDVTGKQKLVVRGSLGLFYDRPAGNTVFSMIANPPVALNTTLDYSNLQSLGGVAPLAPPSITGYQVNTGLPATLQWNADVQYKLPFASLLDIAYVGEHAYNLLESINTNTVDIGSAYLPQNQDPTQSSTLLLGSGAVTANQMRALQGFGSVNMYLPRGWAYSHVATVTASHRLAHNVQFSVSDTINIKQEKDSGARLQHNADGSFTYRSDQAVADQLFNNYIPTRQSFKGDFVWSLPTVHAGSGFTGLAVKAVTSDWQLSGIWSASTPGTYTVGFSYNDGTNNQNLTGSGDFGARIKVVGDPGSGCNSSDIYHQFNISAFAAPRPGSVGLESGNDYLRGCFQQNTDLALQRNFRVGKSETRRLSFRFDAYNAFNQSHITGRSTNMSVTSLTNSAILNLPFDANGNLLASRSQPRNAGFGMVNGYQGARTIQAWLRFTF